MLSELLKIRRELDSLICQQGQEHAALLAEVETLVGAEFFTTKSVFESLPGAIEQFGPKAFPALSASNARSLGKSLAEVHAVGSCGGFEVHRSDTYQNRVNWRLVAL